MLLNNHVQSLWREQTVTATGDTQDGTVSTSSRSAHVLVLVYSFWFYDSLWEPVVIPQQIFERAEKKVAHLLFNCKCRCTHKGWRRENVWLDTGVFTKGDGERTFVWTQVYSRRLTERERLAGNRCIHKSWRRENVWLDTGVFTKADGERTFGWHSRTKWAKQSRHSWLWLDISVIGEYLHELQTLQTVLMREGFFSWSCRLC